MHHARPCPTLPAALVIACCLVAYSSAAAVELTLDEAIERALTHSHELNVAQTNLDTVDARLRRSRALLPSNPYVGASFWDTTATRFVEQRERGIGPSYTFSLSQTFEIAGQRSKRIAMAAHGSDVAHANAALARSNLIAGVRRLFHDAVEAHTRVALASETLHWQRELRRAYERSSRSAQNQAEMRVARAESELDGSNHSLFLAESRLRLLLALDPDEPIVLVGELSDQVRRIPPFETLRDFALAHRADIEAHRNAVAGEDAAVALTRKRAIPDVTISGFVSRSESTRDDLQFGASIGMPLPVFRRSGPDVDEAVASRVRAQLELSHVEAVIVREVREARHAVLVSGVDVDRIGSELLPRAEENLKIAEREFDAGKSGLWELIMAELDRVQVRREHASSLRIYNNALVELERVIGGSLADVVSTANVDAP